jgi:hypothetical protein
MAAESGGLALSIRPRHLLRDAVENRVVSQFELGGVFIAKASLNGVSQYLAELRKLEKAGASC